MLDRYEILVIGSGEAGKYLASTMAKAGRRTALVERKLIGGSCPNVACMPSKNVIHSAKIASYLRRSAEFGGEAVDTRIDMAGVYRRKQAMVDELVSDNLKRFQTSGVELIMGRARFTAELTAEVMLNAGGSRTLIGDKVFLSLGTRSVLPAIPGLSEADPMTHIEALNMQRLPEHLIVLGGGYIALEFAQAFRRFGSSVTVIERGEQLAANEDEDAGRALLELFRDEGINVLLNTTITRVLGRSGTNLELELACPSGTSVIDGTDLLIATGRVPNTQGVGLEELGVELDTRGYIKVNEKLETTSPSVWAMGDCAGTPQFTHAAYDDFRVVRDNLLGATPPRTTRGRLIPSCMFTDPELIRVGLNEKHARELGIPYRIAKFPASAVLRTRTISEPRGFIKMLIAIDSDRILGFTAFCVEASELLAAVQTAMVGDLPYTVLRDAVYTHPTMSEGFVFFLSDVPAQIYNEMGTKNAASTA
jgi:pyruvate/2-oxoglutarate dehydrogenase complex dihydrolipoamide dehydrogenase (E3) component